MRATAAEWTVSRQAGQTARRRWREVLAAAGLAGPCFFLAAHRGGAAPEAQAVAYAWVFAVLALWGLAQWRVGEASRPPLGAVAILAWPLVQLVTLPPEMLLVAEPEKLREIERFLAAGLTVGSRITLYPYATVQAWLALATAVAVYILARDLSRRSAGALGLLAVAVMAVGMAEAIVVIRQYLGIQFGAGPLAATETARGTFGNRNLAAAWMEGCYGVALAAVAGRMASRGALGITVLGAMVVVTLAVGVLCTFSRAGIAAMAAVTAAVGVAYWRSARGRWIWLPVVALATAACAGTVGLPGLARRYAVDSLIAEKEGRLAIWADAARAAWRYLPCGAGAGSFPYAFRRSRAYLGAYTIDHAHNEYLETAVEWGLAGVAMWLGLAAAMWKATRRLRSAAEGHRWLGMGAMAGAAAILLHGAVDFPLRLPAILLLFALLLGMASGAGRPEDQTRKRSGGAATAATAAAAAILAAFTAWTSPAAAGSARRLEQWNVEAHYRAARAAFESEGSEAVELAYRRALERNPYAAPLWRELALLAEARADRAAALAYSGLAEDLEPHTRRGQWAAANLRLRLGDAAGALRLFRSLVTQAPEMRRAVWEACWGGRLDPEKVLETASRHPETLGEYCRYLAERSRWDPLAAACRRAAGGGPSILTPEHWLDIYDRLFAAGAAEPARELWALAGGDGLGFANGELEQPLGGYGLDWVVRPVEGVVVERRLSGERFRLDVEFRRPQNLFYAGVTHDFTVQPGRRYRLRFEAASEEIGSSSGVQVEVVSHRRRLVISEEFRRSSDWRAVEVRFEPRADEGLCRLRVIRALSSRFDNKLSGRFSLRGVRLEQEGPGEVQSARPALRVAAR